MKITLGITTFNRLDYLIKMKRSLEASVNIERLNLRIYDDQSTEYNFQTLNHLFPYASEIIVRSQKLYADGNIKQMYKDFLNTGDDLLINGDSDLIFRPNWLDFLLENFNSLQGVLSLYNSNSHAFIQKNNNLIGFKEHLGSAGTVFNRSTVEKIVKHFTSDDTHAFDWKWSYFLRHELNIKLACSYKTYLQHIGFRGQNNLGVIPHFDFGLNFEPINPINTEIMMELLYDMISSTKQLYDHDIEKNLNLIGLERIFNTIDTTAFLKHKNITKNINTKNFIEKNDHAEIIRHIPPETIVNTMSIKTLLQFIFKKVIKKYISST